MNTPRRTIPALPSTVEGVAITWRRWTPVPDMTHIDTRCPTCAYDGGPVLAFGLAGDRSLIRYQANRCPACDETTVYERVPQKYGVPRISLREVAYFPPRTKSEASP